jgi:hypothetical protein
MSQLQNTRSVSRETDKQTGRPSEDPVLTVKRPVGVDGEATLPSLSEQQLLDRRIIKAVLGPHVLNVGHLASAFRRARDRDDRSYLSPRVLMGANSNPLEPKQAPKWHSRRAPTRPDTTRWRWASA